MQGQNWEAQRKLKEVQVVKEKKEEHVERNNQYFNDPQMKQKQHLQEDIARMVIIETDIVAVEKSGFCR